MRIAAGIVTTVFGVLFLLYIYAHASMVNPELSDEARRSQIIEALFLRSGMSEGTYIGFGLVVIGLWLVVGRPKLGAGGPPPEPPQQTVAS